MPEKSVVHALNILVHSLAYLSKDDGTRRHRSGFLIELLLRFFFHQITLSLYSRHTKTDCFVFKELKNCIQVFLKNAGMT